MKSAVFTVMMDEGYSLETVARRLGELGYDGVEWSVRENLHISPEELCDRAEEVAALTRDNGLEVAALATYLSYEDTDTAAKVIEAAGRMGTEIVRVGAPLYNGTVHYDELYRGALESFEKLLPVCEDSGAKACLEIHLGNIACSPSLALRILENFDPRFVGAIFDPGNMILEGYESWRMGIELLGPYLAHVHVKNTGWFPKEGGGWEWKQLPMESGMVDWKELIGHLKDTGYDGWLSLEDFCDLPLEEKLEGDLEFLRGLV